MRKGHILALLGTAAYAQEGGTVEFDLMYDGPPSISEQLAAGMLLAVTLVLLSVSARFVLKRWGGGVNWSRWIYAWPAFLTTWAIIHIVWVRSESGIAGFSLLLLGLLSLPGIVVAAPLLWLAEDLPRGLQLSIVVAGLLLSHHAVVRMAAWWCRRLHEPDHQTLGLR